MKPERMTKAQLIAEVKRLTPKPKRARAIPRSAFIEYPVKPKPEAPITAGCDLQKDDLLVVKENERTAWPHAEVKTVANEIRIHGYAVRAFKKGQQVRMHHWFDYDPPSR